MRRLTALMCIAAVAPSFARADEAADKVRGKSVWREGVKQYDLGDFDAAIKKFEEAYQIFPNPDILFNLGQAHRKTKSYERAIHYFRTFLRYKPDAPNREVVEQLIAELEGLIAAQKASNERPPDTVHTPPPPPAAPAASPAVESPRWYQDPVGWTLAGAGLVAIGLGTAFLVHSGGLSSDAESTHDEQNAQNLHDSAKTFQIAGGVTLVAGAALLTGGIVKMVLHSRPESGVQVSAGLGTVSLSAKF